MEFESFDQGWSTETGNRKVMTVNRISNDGYEFICFDRMQLVMQLPSGFTAKIGIEDNFSLRFLPRWRPRPPWPS